MMMDTVYINKRGQITIPHHIRKSMKLEEGDALMITSAGDQVILHPIHKTLLDLRGNISVSGEQDFEMIRESVKKTRGMKQNNGE